MRGGRVFLNLPSRGTQPNRALTPAEQVALHHPHGSALFIVRNGDFGNAQAVISGSFDFNSLSGCPDTYFTPNAFTRKGRRKNNEVAFLTSFYVDIDRHDGEHMDVSEIRVAKCATLTAHGLPQPSYDVETGRGIHAYWRLSRTPATPENVAIWQYVQDSLIHLLGADTQVRDTARLMRVSGTENSKTGTTTGAYPVTDERYDLKMFTDVLGLPMTAGTERTPRTSPPPQNMRRMCSVPVDDAPLRISRKANNYTRLFAKHMRFVDYLISARGWKRVPVGQRHNFLFVYAVCVRRTGGSRRQAAEWATRYTSFTPSERDSTLSGIFTGRYYKLSTEHVRRRLGATPDECEAFERMEQDAERTRDRERKERQRRREGRATVAQQATTRTTLTEMANTLRNEGYSTREIARHIGVSKSTAHTYVSTERSNTNRATPNPPRLQPQGAGHHPDTIPALAAVNATLLYFNDDYAFNGVSRHAPWLPSPP